MSVYAEIEDPREIARLNRQLASELRAALRHAERRQIGWPAGRFPLKFAFAHEKVQMNSGVQAERATMGWTPSISLGMVRPANQLH